MQVRSYEEMINAYEDLEFHDKDERVKLLSKYDHSIIFEGDVLEFNNAEEWVNLNINAEKVPWIFYGKLDYDYGFFEFFFDTEEHATYFAHIVPSIFTTYPNGQTLKSIGPGKNIEL